MHLITRCILQRMQGAPRQPSDSSVIGSRASDRNHPWQSRFNVITSWYIVLIILVAILLERRLGLLSRCLSRSRCRSPMSWLWGFCWKRRRPAWSLMIVRVILPASASSSLTSPSPTDFQVLVARKGHRPGWSLVIVGVTEQGPITIMRRRPCNSTWPLETYPLHVYQVRWIITVYLEIGELMEIFPTQDFALRGLDFYHVVLSSPPGALVFQNHRTIRAESRKYWDYQGVGIWWLPFRYCLDIQIANTHTYYTPLGNPETNMLLRIVWLYGIIR